MQQNLLEEVETYFTEDTVSQASAVVGESERGVARAVAKVIPLVLSSFISRAERPGGIEALWTLAHEATAAGGLPGLLTADKLKRRTELMQGLLGEDYASTVSRIADTTRLRPSSVETLLSMTAQAVLQSLGEFADEKELDAAELFAWLEQQKAGIMAAVLLNTSPAAPPALPLRNPPSSAPVPTETGFAGSAGPAWNTTTAATSGSPYASPENASAPPSRTMRWAFLLLAFVMAGAVLEYLFVQNRPGPKAAATPTAPASLSSAGTAALPPKPTGASPTGRYDAASDNYIYDPGRPITLTLVDGTTQTVGVNSTENRLYHFLADASIQVDSVNRTKGWINFDRVYFDAKKSTLTDESRRQLQNIASILKSFPTAKVKIGGYTDNTGDILTNLKLSEERANVAMAELGALGIDINRVQAKGYGVKYPVASNEIPVGRALNRRISIRVTEK